MTNAEHNELGDCVTALSTLVRRLEKLVETIYDPKLNATIAMAANFTALAAHSGMVGLVDGALLIDHA